MTILVGLYTAIQLIGVFFVVVVVVVKDHNVRNNFRSPTKSLKPFVILYQKIHTLNHSMKQQTLMVVV